MEGKSKCGVFVESSGPSPMVSLSFATGCIPAAVIVSDLCYSKTVAKDQNREAKALLEGDKKALLEGGHLSVAFGGGGLSRPDSSDTSQQEVDGDAHGVQCSQPMVLGDGGKELGNREVITVVRLGFVESAGNIGPAVARGLESTKISATPPFDEHSEHGSDDPRSHEVIAKQLKEALFAGGVMSVMIPKQGSKEAIVGRKGKSKLL